MSSLTIDINFYDDAKFDPKDHPHAPAGPHGGQFIKKGSAPLAGKWEFGGAEKHLREMHKLASNATEENVHEVANAFKEKASKYKAPFITMYANKLLPHLEKEFNLPKGSLGKAQAAPGASTGTAPSSKSLKKAEEATKATSSPKDDEVKNEVKNKGNSLPQPETSFQLSMFKVAQNSSLTKNQKIKELSGYSLSNPSSKKYREELIEALKSMPEGEANPPDTSKNTVKSTRPSVVKAMERLKTAFRYEGSDSSLSSHVPSAEMSFWDNLPTEQRKSCRSYTGIAHESINEVLRGKLKATPGLKDLIDQIDEAFEHPDAEIKRDVFVRRGLDMPKEELNRIKESMKQGLPTRSIQHGFTSTSVKQNWSWHGDVSMDILVKKGTPALYVERISQHPNEKELLLRHGQNFEVLEIHEEYGKHRLVVATV